MHPVWSDAACALALLKIDPKGLGGMVIRARSGPVRDALLTAVNFSQKRQKLHPAMTAEALDDTVDLTATLGSGALTMTKGLLSQTDAFILTMAERTEPYLTARLCQAIDRGATIIALDEGASEDEALPPALADRMAFQVTLDELSISDIDPIEFSSASHQAVACPDDIAENLVHLAVSLGIYSLRAPALALATAKAHAVFMDRAAVVEADVIRAVELTYAHRATQLPEPAPETQEPPQPPENSSDPAPIEQTGIPQELLLDAVKAAMPMGLLEKLTAVNKVKSSGSGSGSKQTGNRKGRPLPARAKRRSNDARVDLLASLRAALPWQTLRKAQYPTRNGAIILPEDLRQKRYQDHSDRVLIFCVDASGSAALARLGEAKGAVEILLSEAYARRDHVALIAFRAEGAETLLPPTRSLVQTKRRLANLPGGGGTPLAAGLEEAGQIAHKASAKGLSPTLVLLTDGRSNIALDGTPDRTQAGRDAADMARKLCAQNLPAIVIDTGTRPEPSLSQLADVLRGHYLPLPRADAGKLARAVSQLGT